MSFVLFRRRPPPIRIEITDSPQAEVDAPIPAEWVIEGQPKARSGLVNRSADTFTSTFVWSCTAGRFHWHFVADETVHILEGEVFVTDDEKGERRLGPGSIALFRAGTDSIWHVPHFVKKIAFIYVAPPTALSLCLRALRKGLRRMKAQGKHSSSARLAG